MHKLSFIFSLGKICWADGFNARGPQVARPLPSITQKTCSGQTGTTPESAWCARPLHPQMLLIFAQTATTPVGVRPTRPLATPNTCMHTELHQKSYFSTNMQLNLSTCIKNSIIHISYKPLSKYWTFPYLVQRQASSSLLLVLSPSLCLSFQLDHQESSNKTPKSDLSHMK